MSEKMEIYLLKSDSIVDMLTILRSCCHDRRLVISTLEEPLLKVWAVKLEISEAADILDEGIDINKFNISEHDPHGIIQRQLNVNLRDKKA